MDRLDAAPAGNTTAIRNGTSEVRNTDAPDVGVVKPNCRRGEEIRRVGCGNWTVGSNRCFEPGR